MTTIGTAKKLQEYAAELRRWNRSQKKAEANNDPLAITPEPRPDSFGLGDDSKYWVAMTRQAVMAEGKRGKREKNHGESELL